MYIYKTKGICPPEIHFQLAGNILTGVRFVGGGCRGNAQLISRLLEGRELSEVLPLLKGIQCRNDTSCPDQLFQAIQLAREGKLREEEPITIYEAPASYQRVAVIAEVNGNVEALRVALRQPVEAVFCLGNLTGPAGDNDGVVELVRREKLVFIQGPFDRTLPCTKPENREFLRRAPLYLRFQLGRCRVLGFYSGFIQELSGFSDYAPYSLELLMVSNLSDYLRNESVFSALEAMTEQFSVDLVLFASTNEWKHVRLGKVDFINVGPLKEDGQFKYALLEWAGEELQVSFETVKA
ncbi:uncharacterized protein (TIGR03905 family) [Desulfofundulus luciae]|uniref:ribonucleoside-diphosphate reductase n=1 Tax=Desulfofundulus luciae TaxID=74702 RepID=A0ABU0AXP3_9FIRM|nr:TIGR03905 family TSCPD domain-containing protein [Desulfofundulus luciae]MDQ0285240.1 uncharacterized protein (TIGR03905 family) [Desulfofundulus luciae]